MHPDLTERRRKLRDVLVERGPEAVNMNIWARYGDVDFNLEDLAWHRGEVPCGTVACLVGWGALVAGDEMLVDDVAKMHTALRWVLSYYGFEAEVTHVRTWCHTSSPTLRGVGEALTRLHEQEQAVDTGAIEHLAIVGFLNELIEEDS